MVEIRTKPATDERLLAFELKAGEWQRYTETPLGRLRQELTLHHVLERLARCAGGCHILDAGAGTGGYALALAQAGHHVTLLDLSPTMLSIARERIQASAPGLSQQVSYCCASVESIHESLPGARFDAILVHTLLEYLEDPWQTLRDLLTLLAPRGILSLLAANAHADAMRWALVKDDLERAREALHAQSSPADLFGLPRRTLASDRLLETLRQAGIVDIAQYGVRIFADYLPAERLADPGFSDALWRLELEASSLSSYLGIARYHHILGSKT